MTPLMADQPPDAGDPGGRSSVKAGLTSNRRRQTNRRRRTVENDEYARFVRRVMRAYARRVASGDVDALVDMTGLATELGRRWFRVTTRRGKSRPSSQIAVSRSE